MIFYETTITIKKRRDKPATQKTEMAKNTTHDVAIAVFILKYHPLGETKNRFIS